MTNQQLYYLCVTCEKIITNKNCLCKKCKIAAYCSRECQKRHFPIHKGDCQFFANVMFKKYNCSVIPNKFIRMPEPSPIVVPPTIDEEIPDLSLPPRMETVSSPMVPSPIPEPTIFQSFDEIIQYQMETNRVFQQRYQ
jgi:hypothetical protein